MEDMLWKFPHVGEGIFKRLSNKNMVKCKKVCRNWEYFITNKRFHKQRVVFEMRQKKVDKYGWTPLHTAARAGELSECKQIMKYVENKNPRLYI